MLDLFLGDFNQLFLFGCVWQRFFQQHASSAFGGVSRLVVVFIVAAALAFVQTFSLVVVVVVSRRRRRRRRGRDGSSLVSFRLSLHELLVVGVRAKLFPVPGKILAWTSLVLVLRSAAAAAAFLIRRRLLLPRLGSVLFLFFVLFVVSVFGQSLRQLLLEPRVLSLFHRSLPFRRGILLCLLQIIIFFFVREFLRLLHPFLHVVELSQKRIRVFRGIDF